MFRISKFLAEKPQNFKKIIESNLRCFATQAAVKNAANEKPEKHSTTKESQSFTMNIFRGHLQPSQVFPFPEVLNEDQHDTLKLLIDPFERFFEEINDPMKNDKNACIDKKTMDTMWETGAFCLQVPQEYGGLGLNNTQYCRCVEVCGYHDLGVGITLGAHQSIGFKGILLFGTPELKKKYLPRVCSGDMAAFCLTEPSSGSDAGSIRSRAVKSADGSHYVLNGSKIWISNGGLAEIMTVFAKVPTKDPKTGETKEKVTAFIVERSFGGVTSGPPEEKMGIKCSNTAEVYFEDVKIPAENILSEEGEGFKVAMTVLNNGRFGMAAALSGTMRYCIKKAVDHATQRVQFGRTIDNYGTIQEKLGRMAMLQYITESLGYTISGNMDSGSQDYHLEAAISKCFASESAWWVCDEAIQILGGMGYMRDAGLERVMRDLRIFKIFEGTNDILRLFVALTGIQYAGSHLTELLRAFKNPTANLGLIFEEATKRATRAIGLGSSPSLTHSVHPKLEESAALCTKVQVFVFVDFGLPLNHQRKNVLIKLGVGDFEVTRKHLGIEMFGQGIEDSLRKYGHGIVDEQFVLNRIAQVAVDSYTMAVVLSRATMAVNKNLPSAEHEFIMAQTWCAEASDRVKQNLNAISSGKHLDVFSKLSKISRNMCDHGGCVQSNPLGF